MQPTDFQHQSVRDLAWVMAAPGLLDRQGFWQGRCVGDDWCQSTYADHLDWLSSLDREPDGVLNELTGPAYPGKPGFRLGHYVEQLLALWLKQVAGPAANQVRCGLSIRSGKRTIGELDLLYPDRRSGDIHHWEVTWKLHLRTPGTGLGAWYGLHPRDRLEDKIKKMFTEQLKLAEHPEAHKQLDKTFGHHRVRSRALVKGQLFYPLHDSEAGPTSSLSPDHLRGFWLYKHQAEELLPAGRDERWAFLSRQEWLAPAVRSQQDSDLLARRQCLQQLQKAPDIPQVCALLRRDLSGRWLERDRFVIVTDDWQPGVWRNPH